MRLGFVGVGKWARKLADSFRECGAEIVAHDRNRIAELDYARDSILAPGFGRREFWRDQMADKSIDAIVAVAPPDVTTEVFCACVESGKPVLGTKPLMAHPARTTAPAYVDFWRLWSVSHRGARERINVDPIAPLTINLYGNGPFRSFPGALDYGPHVFAAALDLCPDVEFGRSEKINSGLGETFRIIGKSGRRRVTLYYGNAQDGPAERSYRVGDWCERENGENIGNETKSAAVRAMCKSFMSDVAEGVADARTMNLSRESMRLLQLVTSQAT